MSLATHGDPSDELSDTGLAKGEASALWGFRVGYGVLTFWSLIKFIPVLPYGLGCRIWGFSAVTRLHILRLNPRTKNPTTPASRSKFNVPRRSPTTSPLERPKEHPFPRPTQSNIKLVPLLRSSKPGFCIPPRSPETSSTNLRSHGLGFRVCSLSTGPKPLHPCHQ